MGGDRPIPEKLGKQNQKKSGLHQHEKKQLMVGILCFGKSNTASRRFTNVQQLLSFLFL